MGCNTEILGFQGRGLRANLPGWGEVILSKKNNIRDVNKVCNSRVYPRATGNAVFAKHQHSGQRKVGDGGINSSERLVCHTTGL